MANPYSIIPLSFGSCAGSLHQSTGNVGVLLCSPLGLEELCLRRAWRMLATLCADADYPTLRFDYPGCGDSVGELAGVAGIDALADAAVEAAGELRRRGGVERLVLAGHGLGAAVAALAAPRVGAAAAALFAPPTSGRVHVKEFETWGRRAAEELGLPPGARGAEAVGAFRLPEPLRASIEALDLRTLPAPPAPAIFLAARANCPADADLAERLSRSGASVSRTVYDEHAAALEAPTAARPPLDLFAAFAAWLEQAAPIRGRRASVAAQSAPAAQLDDEAFSETAVRFGPGGRLAGVTCSPRAPRKGATILFLNSGGDPHAGLGRSTVAQARALARRGVASLRMDMSDLGDSAGAPSSEPPRVYDPQHVEDVLTAIDWLEANAFGPVMLVGRRSGASVAFSAAARDPRIRHLVLINPPALSVDLAAAAEHPVNRFGYYLARAREPFRQLRRLSRGELDLQAVVGKLGQAVASLGLVAADGERKASALHQALARLGARGARLTLLFAEDDPHRADILAALAAEGRRLEGQGCIEVRLLDRTDCAFTAASTKSALPDLLVNQALEAQAPAPSTPTDRRGGRGRQGSGLPGAAPQPRPSA